MSIKKGIGFGLLLWIIMFAIVSVFIAFNWYDSEDAGAMAWIIAVLGGAVSFILAGYAKPSSSGSALALGFTFVVIGLLLDWLITTRFSPDIFSQAPIWVSYALILFAPILRVQKTAMPPREPNPRQPI